MTETQKRIAEWHATRPAFVGKPSAAPLSTTKAERRAAKNKLVKRASGK